MPAPTEPIDRVRLDKWLWAARFFKHRTDATAAVDGGKVHLNGLRVKPAKDVKAGDRLEIVVGDATFVVLVRGVAEKRGPAAVAQQLYEETEESRLAREQRREEHRLAATPGADLHGRPTKRDRRQIRRFTGDQ